MGPLAGAGLEVSFSLRTAEIQFRISGVTSQGLEQLRHAGIVVREHVPLTIFDKCQHIQVARHTRVFPQKLLIGDGKNRSSDQPALPLLIVYR